MAMYDRVHVCPNCLEDTGLSVLECSNCHTVGCNRGNCGIGSLGQSFCNICNKVTETTESTYIPQNHPENASL